MKPTDFAWTIEPKGTIRCGRMGRRGGDLALRKWPFRRGGLLCEKPRQLGPRPYFELAVSATQVEIHGLRAEEKPRTDLLAGQPIRSGERHLEFLWR
jgi:hypothetical protein